MGDLRGKKFAVVEEGCSNAAYNVRSRLLSTIDELKKAGAEVEFISLPEHKQGNLRRVKPAVIRAA